MLPARIEGAGGFTCQLDLVQRYFLCGSIDCNSWLLHTICVGAPSFSTGSRVQCYCDFKQAVAGLVRLGNVQGGDRNSSRPFRHNHTV